jgi:ribose 5-phosphate isomerase B
MRVAVAFDHRGVRLRDAVLSELDALGHETFDLGVDTSEVRIDYPDKAGELGRLIQNGVGASVAVSKVDGVRGAMCHDVYSAHQGVEHDDMNVLCLGSEVVGPALTIDLIRAFLHARFYGREPYTTRLRKIEEIEKGSANVNG